MTTGRAGYPQNQYSVGQMLIDPSGSLRAKLSMTEGMYSPALRDGPIARLKQPILVSEGEGEVNGQVSQVVFVEELVQTGWKWFLYSGIADSELGVAVAEVQT